MSDATSTAQVIIYSTGLCPYCTAAKQLLHNKGVAFTEIAVDKEPERRAEMMQKANGGYTVPQIFINDSHIGGYTDMAALDSSGQLNELLFPTQ